MQQQEPEFMFERDSGLCSIAGCALGRDNHIAEQIGLNACPFAFEHRKRNDIGRPVAPQVVTVDLLNPGVVEQNDRQLPLRISRDV